MQPAANKLPKNDQKDLKFYMIDRVFSSFDKIGSPGFKTRALPRTLIDFYHFIDLLGQAGCNVVVVDINVDAHIDANIAHFVWLKLWAMFTLLPIYLRCPIGFCAHLHTIVFSSYREMFDPKDISRIDLLIYVQFRFKQLVTSYGFRND